MGYGLFIKHILSGVFIIANNVLVLPVAGYLPIKHHKTFPNPSQNAIIQAHQLQPSKVTLMVAANYMAGLFGRSPIRPLQEHMTRVFSGVKFLIPLVEGMNSGDFDAVNAAHQEIVRAEHDADDMKKELRHHLPKGLFMPVDRRDLLDVLMMQDNVVNQAKDIAGLVVGRKMSLPEPMRALFHEYTEQCVKSVEQALAVINELDELVETGFRGLEVARVEAMLVELGRIENLTDQQQVKLRNILFGLEDVLRATDVMFTYRLIEWMGRVADDAQRVGSRLQLMLAR